MTSDSTAYKYTIPLDKSGGISSPIYEPSGNGKTLTMRVGSESVVMVCTEACPHFHRDSVNVQVEEVDKSDYEN